MQIKNLNIENKSPEVGLYSKKPIAGKGAKVGDITLSSRFDLYATPEAVKGNEMLRDAWKNGLVKQLFIVDPDSIPQGTNAELGNVSEGVKANSCSIDQRPDLLEHLAQS